MEKDTEFVLFINNIFTYQQPDIIPSTDVKIYDQKKLGNLLYIFSQSYQ